MADLGFSLLPGTANAANATLSPITTNGPSELSLLDFNVQSTRKTLEILLAQVQLLTMRVDTLEKQNAFLLNIFQQQQQPNLANTNVNAGGAAQNVPGANSNVMHTNNGSNSPYLSPRQIAPGVGGAGGPSLVDSPSAAAKQLEDDLTRLGMNLLNSPSQQQVLADGYNGGNPLLALQQQQLAAALAQHQREEAIIQMLQGQGSPTTATPTATFPLGFPNNNNNNNNSSGSNNNSTTGERISSDAANANHVANMAYLYSPGPPLGGSPNAPQQQQPHSMMLPQQRNAGGGAPPMFSANGLSSGMFGFSGGLAAAGSNNNAAGGGGGGNAAMLPLAPSGAPTNLVTTVTLDPSKSNTNESLDRVCQQPWLKELIMKNCKNISNFAPIAKLRNLWKLNLQGCSQHVDDTVVKLISTYNKRLSRLNLCGCERISNATALQNLSFLFDLNLSGCSIGNDSLEAVANGCQQLSRLAINSCPLITDISSLSKLKELKLLYCRYSGHITPASIVQVLHAIGGGLLTLNVDGVKFAELPNLLESNAAGAGGAGLPCPLALKNLNMKDNTELTSLAWLASIPHAERYFANVEMLDVEGCPGLTDLGNLSALPNLKILRLSKTGVSQEVLDSVVARCPSVITLYLDGCQQIKSVESLARMSTLRKAVVDQSLNSVPAAINGLSTLYQTNRVEVVFALYNGNANAAPGGHHPHHHYGGGSTSLTPSGSPTSNFVPAMPTSDRR